MLLLQTSIQLCLPPGTTHFLLRALHVGPCVGCWVQDLVKSYRAVYQLRTTWSNTFRAGCTLLAVRSEGPTRVSIPLVYWNGTRLWLSDACSFELRPFNRDVHSWEAGRAPESQDKARKVLRRSPHLPLHLLTAVSFPCKPFQTSC